MGRKTQFGDSLIKNEVAYNEYIDRFTELSVSMFEWKNLPPSIDERFLELTLFFNGVSVFFKDDGLNEYLALKCACNGPFNVYRIPINRRAYAVNGYQNNLTDKNSVLIYNNMIHTNSVRMVRVFAERLYELDRIIEVNAKAQKTPVMVIAPENQRLTMKNLYMQYDGNQPFIFGDKNLDWQSLKAISTEAPYVADKIYELKTRIWNEALTYLGISNLSVQKKERLVSDEVIRSQGGTIASRYSRLESRRKACKQINNMFGLNVDVDFREDFREVDDEYVITGRTGDETTVQAATDLRTRGGKIE